MGDMISGRYVSEDVGLRNRLKPKNIITCYNNTNNTNKCGTSVLVFSSQMAPL
jgi:hypothetical protein